MKAAKMPDHVKRAVEERTGAPIGARWVRPRLCTCRRWTLTALDDDVMAVDAVVDPVALTALGEHAAVIAGWPTYELRVDRTSKAGTWRTYLTLRTTSRRLWWPAGGPAATYDVVVAHQHVDPLSGPLATTSRLKVPGALQPVDEGAADGLVPF